jgi:actin-related protein 3
LAGRDITNFIQQFIRDREGSATIPPEESLMVAQKIKEEYGYVCSDIAKEFKKFDEKPDKHIKQFSRFHKKTGKVIMLTFDFLFRLGVLMLALNNF